MQCVLVGLQYEKAFSYSIVILVPSPRSTPSLYASDTEGGAKH